jgi:hypothetical protein
MRHYAHGRIRLCFDRSLLCSTMGHLALKARRKGSQLVRTPHSGQRSVATSLLLAIMFAVSVKAQQSAWGGRAQSLDQPADSLPPQRPIRQRVPDLQGMTQNQASAVLERARLGVDVVGEDPSNQAAGRARVVRDEHLLYTTTSSADYNWLVACAGVPPGVFSWTHLYGTESVARILWRNRASAQPRSLR